MAIRSLAYLVIDATDVGAWRRFGCDILGMQDVGDSEGVLLRMDDRVFRFHVRPAEQDRVAAMGFEYPTRSAYDAGLAVLDAAGIAYEVGSGAAAKARGVQGLAVCKDPSGNPLELCWGSHVAGTRFVSPTGVSAFVTGEGGLGHVVLPTDRYAETRSFYKDVLGFGDSDEMRAHLPGGPEEGLGISFMHASGPRHHSVAVAEFPAPSGLIHVMAEVATIDDVGIALDRAVAAGMHISATIGRHTNDRMVSFYVRSPGGFDIEYGYDGTQYPDWSTVTPTFTIKEDLWGHKWDFGQ